MAKHNAATFWLTWWPLLSQLSIQHLKFVLFCVDNELNYDEVIRLARLIDEMRIKIT